MSLLLAALAAAQPVMDCDTISFSRSPALRRSSEQVGICNDPDSTPTARHHLFRRTTTNPERITYASTRTCPAARAQLEALERLELPVPDVPGLGNDLQVITMDGAGYRLRANALYGQHGADIAVGSNIGTPLARWIDATLAALAPCWRDRP